MSNPSFENIDRWFFEYSEGNLSSSQVEQLESFISGHPELEAELDVWKNANVTPERVTFSSTSLIKAKPYYLDTKIAAILVVSLLFGGYFLYDTFGNNSKYSMSKNDLGIIEFEDDDFFNNIVSKAKAKVQNDDIKKKKRRSNSDDFSKSDNYRTEKFLKTQKKNKGELLIEDSKESNLNSTINDFKNHDNLIEENNLLASNIVSSSGLASVKAYLDRVERGDAIKNENAQHGGNKVDVSQNNFKRKFEKALRNIRRMADQPIALRNTKDQYLHVPMMTGYRANFAMAGSVVGNRIQTTSRNQFAGMNNQQIMNTVSWDGYVYALRGGLGIDVSYNNYSNNSIDNYEASLTYSPKFSVNKNVSIEPAVRFKMGAINVDTKSPIIGSSIEMKRNTVLPLFQGATTPIGSQLWYRDIGAGVLLNTKWFYAGVNVDNIGGHYNNFHSSDLTGKYNEDIHLTSLIGTEYQSTTRDFSVSGYVLHQKYGDLNEVWAGSNFQWKWIQIGAAVNSNLGYGGSAGIKFEKFSLHYNLDNVYSRLIDEKLLSHQLTMRISLRPSRYAAKFFNM